MRLLSLSLFFCITSLTTAYAQAGIYRTYRDFLDDRVMEEYAEYIETDHVLGKFKVRFKTRSGDEREIKIKKDQYWGYRTEDGMIYKINRNGDPFLIVERGVINAYTNFRSYFNDEGKLVVEYGSSFPPTFSVGDKGEMKYLKKSKLKRYVKDLGDEEDLKALKKCTGYPNELVTFIINFNKKYAAKLE